MRPGQECGENLPTDPFQPLPQDQRQAWRDQQHPCASPAVRMATASHSFGVVAQVPRGAAYLVYIVKRGPS